jgi:hypothetical protein
MFMTYYLQKAYHTMYKIEIAVTTKSHQDPDPDPHGFALVWLPGY